MARPLSLTTLLCSVAVALAACGTVPNPLNLLGSQVVVEPSQTVLAPPQPVRSSLKPVHVVISEDYAVQIKLVADNLKLKQELADARKQNTRLKKQLSDEIQKNSLLKDLATRKISMD